MCLIYFIKNIFFKYIVDKLGPSKVIASPRAGRYYSENWDMWLFLFILLYVVVSKCHVEDNGQGPTLRMESSLLQQ